jgi:RNA 3'-terminal phosphate cyclase-like protein
MNDIVYDQGGHSPGYGVMLVAETTSGCLLSAEVAVNQRIGGEVTAGPTPVVRHQHGKGEDKGVEGGGPLIVPEDIGSCAAQMLLEEIDRWGACFREQDKVSFFISVIATQKVSL